MKKINFSLVGMAASVVGSLLFSPLSNAAVTSLVGDIDGFGGATVSNSPPNGVTLTCCFDNRSGEDPFFTDVWSFQKPETPQTVTYTHAYDPTSLLAPTQLATLSIQSAGMGNDRGPWSVLFNGVSVGAIGGPGVLIGSTEVVTSFFDIPLLLLNPTGMDQISLVFQQAGSDGFAINYSQLTLLTSVPIPGGFALFLSALSGGLICRHHKTRKTKST